ncbi:MAG: TetR/AcrR family transcriptional regulator [Novosphingobium sp.]
MRARLAKAAYDEIAEKGHSDFRTAPVFARAGVSKGGMQHYFPTKDALILAAVEYAFDQARAASDEYLRRPAESTEAVVMHLLDDLEEYFGHNRFIVSLDITLHAAKSETLAAEIRHRISEARMPVYRKWAERLTEVGYPDDSAQFVVETATALVSGSAIRKLWTTADPGIKQKWAAMILGLKPLG